MPSLMRNSFFNMLYQLVLLLVPLASAMYVSRVVMPEGLGEIATAENLVSYFTALAPLGIPAYGLRARRPKSALQDFFRARALELRVNPLVSGCLCDVRSRFLRRRSTRPLPDIRFAYCRQLPECRMAFQRSGTLCVHFRARHGCTYCQFDFDSRFCKRS